MVTFSWFSTVDRRLWQLALPMILSNITVPLLGLVDTAVMGHLDNAVYLSAVAVGSMVITFITMMFNFLRMSTTGMTAQAYGANNQTAIARALLQPLLLGLLIGLGLWLLRTPLTAWGLELSGAQGELAQLANSYLAIRFWAAPATLANLVLLGWLLGMQHMKAPVLLLVWGNLLNIVLDIYLVWYAGWQVRGAAWASVCAEYLTLLLGLGLVHYYLRRGGVSLRAGWQCWSAGLRRLLGLNRDIFLRSLVLQLCFAAFTVLGTRLGAEVVAVNALLLNFLTFTAFALDGFAYAVEALAGHAIGAHNTRELQLMWRAACRQALAVALLFSSVYLLCGTWLIDMLTSLPALRAQARVFLPWLWLLPLVGMGCYLLDGLFIGATRGREMRNSMLIAGGGYLLTVWLALPLWGNHGLWLALLVFLLLRGVSLEYYRRRVLLPALGMSA